ncbi:hypothetical protein Trydic_g21663 [Trypoxylus dichotomus]
MDGGEFYLAMNWVLDTSENWRFRKCFNMKASPPLFHKNFYWPLVFGQDSATPFPLFFRIQQEVEQWKKWLTNFLGSKTMKHTWDVLGRRVTVGNVPPNALQ